MVSGISNTNILPSDLDEICDKLTLLLQQKPAAKKSKIFNEEIIAISAKLLDYKCISKKQHKQISIKSNLLHTTKKKV